ncbi:TonB-dependent receptor [Cocleimonas sp. KMM 6892]|uniref:TonB-dependent receptor domain-containing protein n=1 Tax=unclassified Cocleimonas TaxID=2639732 RepID=UPI002DB89830|nr:MULTISPECIES: TonB-dependent receptor [unclassified Cocleimonas]MEB8430880.1 TonB-dependent receptor [Cocleimonas sp. KMM 6892]MEC4714348.1 TonB-dependent receptor [Cocleimonas sp. KMM 6895]MEC4743679.1 TonB-dependent receptor [Cocleimonas sp. KMM 6896]
MKYSPVATKVAPFSVLAIMLASFQSPVFADESDNISLSDDGSLELTVTANRRPVTANKTLAPVTVITQEDISRHQDLSVEQALTRVPGLNISNTGGLGKNTSVFLRGTNSGHVLVLVDGVRLGSATLGSTSFQHIPVDQIDRIEVVRGPRSSLYGSEAIGGVIQIFTKKGQKGFSPSISLSAGSNSTYKGNVNLSGGNNKTTYQLNVSKEETDGIDACNSTSSGCFADEPDRDGYERESVSLNVGHKFSDAVKGGVSILRAEGSTDFDGGFQNESDFVQEVISANLSGDVTDKLNLRFTVGQSKDENDNFKDGTFTGDFATKQNTASLIANYAINNNNNLLLGTDWVDAEVDSNTEYDVTSRDNTGVFASYATQLNKTHIDTSLRYDDNEQFGSETTGGIAFGQELTDSMRLKASYGTAFKAPTFNQLYYPGFGSTDLLPEKSENYELGLDGKFSNGSWEVNVFQNDIDNLIAGFPVSNIDEARIRGIEAVFATKLAGFDVAANVTLQKPENRTGDNKGKILRNRSEQILNIDVDRKFGKFTIGATVHAESERYANVDNSVKLGGFTTLDLRTSYAVSKDWSVGAKIANALDKDYSLASGYNQDGINGLVTVKYAPK